MREIPLTQGYIALVDDDDYADLIRFKWFSCTRHRVVYPATHISGGGELLMPQHIMGKPARGFLIDHIDHNGLNNQRQNLRFVTKAENAMNSRKQTIHLGQIPSSIYKGVCWDKARGKWTVYIKIGGVRKFLGRFDDEKEAALAYNVAAKKLFGAYAYPNEV